MSQTVAIVGGGQAGASLAAALRARGFAGRVHLCCAEGVLPYERPPLSKAMLNATEPGQPTWVLPEQFYDDQQIDVHLGTSVVGVLPARGRHTLRLERGGVLTADAVVLATGSTPRGLTVPGAALPGVHTLGSLADLEALRGDLATAQHVVVAGGGLIGAEVASGLRGRGISVTVLDPIASPLAAKTADWAAEVLRRRHDEAGVRSLQSTVARVRGVNRVEAVVTGSGVELDCDVLLVAVGVRPATALAESIGLDCLDGVLCDERGQTSAPGIHAIGDVAAWRDPWLGQVRVEHYRTAIDHADVVAAGILGIEVPRLRTPWFWTDQYEHRVEVAGRPALGDQAVLRPGATGRTALSVHLRGGRVVGVVGLDTPRDVRAVSRLIDSQSVLDPGAVADATTDLRKAVLT